MKRTFVFHPFLFGIYAVLGVYSQNAIELPVQWVLRPLIVILCLISIIFYFLQIKNSDAQHVGLVTTLTLFWLFFGHFQRSLFEISPFWGSSIGVFFALLIWTVPLGLLGSKWAWSRISNSGLITSFLNVTSLIVILMPVYITGEAGIRTALFARANENRNYFSSPKALDVSPMQPDIYLIIMDAYGREDFLREIYGFDNGEFINDLKKRGFYVADESTANYPQTVLSLSSSLNMQYLNSLTEDFENTRDRGVLNYLIQQSEVRRLLHNAGYRFVAFPTSSLFTQMRDADVYLEMTLGNLNEFEGLLLSSTVINLVVEAWGLNLPVFGYNLHRQYILFSFEKLETIAEEEGPKFVFVHIMAPHPPFVFDELGNSIQPDRPFNPGDATTFPGTHEEYVMGYTDEVQYINQRLIKAIDIILMTSEIPPVIIIQGDHGPGNYFELLTLDTTCLMERYSILNAYYFPDKNYKELYPMITPVNSFRVVFNQYFGGDFALLDDKNYYAGWFTPYVYQDVSDQTQTCNLEQN